MRLCALTPSIVVDPIEVAALIVWPKSPLWGDRVDLVFKSGYVVQQPCASATDAQNLKADQETLLNAARRGDCGTQGGA